MLFAVSVCKGLAMKKADLKSIGGIRYLVRWIPGADAAGRLSSGISVCRYHRSGGSLDRLCSVGIDRSNLLKEAFEKKGADDCTEVSADLSFRIMFVMAVATSIDALAVGISLAMAGSVSIWPAVLLIGMTTFVLSAAGVKIGNLFGSRFEKKAQLAGGVILILLGVKILAEHLGLISG